MKVSAVRYRAEGRARRLSRLWQHWADRRDRLSRDAIRRERLKETLTHSHDPQLLQQYATKALKKNDRFLLYAIADNSFASSNTLQELSRSEDVNVLTRVAKNPATPLTLLKALSQSQRYLGKAHVFQNPAVSGDIVETLASDHDSRIRELAADYQRRMPIIQPQK